MVTPKGSDLPVLPPAEERRLSDYEAAYLALLGVHGEVAIRLIELQAYVERVLDQNRAAKANKNRQNRTLSTDKLLKIKVLLLVYTQ